MITALLGALVLLAQPALPSDPLVIRDFTLQFNPAGTFSLSGEGWPAMAGSWVVNGGEITLQLSAGPKDCAGPGRYRFVVDGARVAFDVIDDGCTDRRMILDRSQWYPPGQQPKPAERKIARSSGSASTALPAVAPGSGNWPTFRGREAAGVADGQKLPDHWNPATGENILWKTTIPGLAHSSPIVWGDLVFVTSAISGKPNATFKPGLYGDGDASDDRTAQRWMLYAVDKKSGKIRWEREATHGEPLNKRHMKSTYASASPATDGRIVVAWFGSQGIYAYDFSGALRWKVDIGRVDMGAYDIPSYEWGPASSPIIWNGMVIVQCDTQADSFLLALNAETGETLWKTDRQELPSWGTPNIVTTPSGPALVTNASNFIRGYDPKTGRELWKLGGSSKITAPTPIFSNGLHIVASGRAPERPIFAIRPDGSVAWSKTGRGSYMPTPLAYRGLLYILNNNGVFDAYDVATGKEVYRQRLPQVGSGFSASPVAADGKIYLSSEDGDMLVIEAGEAFKVIATTTMGQTIMATPALSEGVMYVRGASTLFAIAKR